MVRSGVVANGNVNCPVDFLVDNDTASRIFGPWVAANTHLGNPVLVTRVRVEELSENIPSLPRLKIFDSALFEAKSQTSHLAEGWNGRRLHLQHPISRSLQRCYKRLSRRNVQPYISHLQILISYDPIINQQRTSCNLEAQVRSRIIHNPNLVLSS